MSIVPVNIAKYFRISDGLSSVMVKHLFPKSSKIQIEECRVLGCGAVWYLLLEPHGATLQNTEFFIVTAVKTSNHTKIQISFIGCLLLLSFLSFAPID
jgi:hypothetical protein